MLCCYFIEACFFDNEKKGVNVGGRGGIEELGRIDEGGSVIRKYCTRKESILKKGGGKNVITNYLQKSFPENTDGIWTYTISQTNTFSQIHTHLSQTYTLSKMYMISQTYTPLKYIHTLTFIYTHSDTDMHILTHTNSFRNPIKTHTAPPHTAYNAGIRQALYFTHSLRCPVNHKREGFIEPFFP